MPGAKCDVFQDIVNRVANKIVHMSEHSLNHGLDLFLARFEMDAERVQGVMNSDAELLIFGFEWIKHFLTGTAFLKQKTGQPPL